MCVFLESSTPHHFTCITFLFENELKISSVGFEVILSSCAREIDRMLRTRKERDCLFTLFHREYLN